jgi:hypothetical protein
MPINVCLTKGNLGDIQISPKNVSTTGNQKITYTISVKTDRNSVDINGEFRIEEASNVKTGEFNYLFDDIQKRIFSIRQTENGFTFKFKSKNDRLVFDLIPTNFFSLYEAALIVDADVSGYGTETVSLDINPETQIIEADNYEDYKDQFGLDTSLPPTEVPKIPEIEPKIDINNEYNFYQKDFEETTLQETQLLNINKNYSTAEILRYFKSKPPPINQVQTLLHTKDYMNSEYPILDKQKNLFPMYMEIKFETDNSKAGLTSFLSKIEMLEYFCFTYMRSSFQNNNATQVPYSINLFEFLELLKTPSKISDNEITSIFTGKVSSIKSFLKRSLQKTLLLKILDKQISLTPNLIKDEILMYKLQKFKGETLLDTQYFINNFENMELIAFDTQLKYDIEYEYRISKIEILSDNMIKETLIDSYVAKTRIIDSPPLPPDVNFIPFKGVDDEILINLNTSFGSYSDYPIIIRDSDYPIFNKILENRKYSKLSQNENKIKFEADEGNFIFEMYRLEKPPSSYSDFKDGYSVTTEQSSILDTIQPNKKYYYILRAKDIHGNLSNPTKPIEIEIINENGTIFMLKKEYIFGEAEKNVSKTFKNIIEIKPAKEQAEINPQLSYEKDSKTKKATSAKQINMILGNKEVSLWNKPFLMRITSKKTGKKVDIKFKFAVSKPK